MENEDEDEDEEEDEEKEYGGNQREEYKKELARIKPQKDIER
jgi:hypothetical protein